MRKFNFKIQAAFLALGLVLSVTSQATPPPRGDTVWNGYYFGAYYGAGAGNTRTEIDTQTFSFINVPIGDSQLLGLLNSHSQGTLKGKVTGSIADLFFGYNFYEPSYNLVLGAQLEGSIFSDITWKSTGDVDSLDTSASVFITSDGVSTLFSATNGIFTEENIDRLRSKFAFVGRVGYLFNPCSLIYGLVGPVAGHFVLPAFEIDGLDSFNSHKNQWELGYTVGAGLELKMNDHWSLRGEYRYLSFDFDRKLNGETDAVAALLFGDIDFGFASATVTQKTKTKFHDHLGEIGIVYSF